MGEFRQLDSSKKWDRKHSPDLPKILGKFIAYIVALYIGALNDP